jgi:Ca2+-binding EF-hand superfamily protein
MQIHRLDDDLALAFDIEEMEAHYFDFDDDGYISSDELSFFVLLMLDPYRSDVSFTRGHAKLAVMMADRDGDGKLSMAEMQSLIDGSYKDDAMMTTELSTA